MSEAAYENTLIVCFDEALKCAPGSTAPGEADPFLDMFGALTRALRYSSCKVFYGSHLVEFVVDPGEMTESKMLGLRATRGVTRVKPAVEFDACCY